MITVQRDYAQITECVASKQKNLPEYANVVERVTGDQNVKCVLDLTVSSHPPSVLEREHVRRNMLEISTSILYVCAKKDGLESCAGAKVVRSDAQSAPRGFSESIVTNVRVGVVHAIYTVNVQTALVATEHVPVIWI